MKYVVYFEIYGRKMKTTVEAPDRRHAEQQVRDRLVIIKVETEVEWLRRVMGIM